MEEPRRRDGGSPISEPEAAGAWPDPLPVSEEPRPRRGRGGRRGAASGERARRPTSEAGGARGPEQRTRERSATSRRKERAPEAQRGSEGREGWGFGVEGSQRRGGPTLRAKGA